jgi:peptide/nickel transport system substrate-binding protein
MGRNDHPHIPELKDAYRQRQISRREFMRYGALLGLSIGSISTFLTGCDGGTPTTPPATEPTVPAAPGAITRGGTMRISIPVMRVDHPARYSWVSAANIMRHVCEYLTYTDKDNISHPYLCKAWEPSDDLKTWTLRLQEGVKWNNGDDFVADDVVFTLKQWLDPEVGSSMAGLMSYLSPNNIEKADDHTVILHLDAPQIAVPEHLFEYPAQVLNHRTFDGDILKNPVGTGPFTLEEYTEGERAVLRRREGYWQKGADGTPLPYLDELIFVDLGEEMSAHIAAFQAGQIDSLDFGDNPPLPCYQALKDHPDAVVRPVATSITRAVRMRVDKAPWNDVRVRQALKLCQQREKILQLAYFGEGVVGQDAHISPAHPAYCEIPTPEYDPERAKQLLAEAGYPDGLDVEMVVSSAWPEVVSYGEILKEGAAPAGLRINLKTMPGTAYWDVWTDVDCGITPWTHRPVATMVLSLAYSGDAEGNPAAWNETRWLDEEFMALLQEAEGTLDIDARREIYCKLEKIQQERGPVGIAFWMNQWNICRKGFEGVNVHPTHYNQYMGVWKKA